MAYLNRLTLVGMTEPEVITREMDSGAPMLSFRLAVDRGGRDEATDRFVCVMYGDKARGISRWLKPGLQVLVEGSCRLGGHPSGERHLLVAVANVVALSRYEVTRRVDGSEAVVSGARLERLP